MPRPLPSLVRMPRILRQALVLLLFIATGSAGLLADTSSRLRSVPAGTCYCGCTESHAKGGCVKMCELPKYASRWWATTCVKPRIRRPANDSNAGPHLHHPNRATYAQLQK